MCWKRSAKSGRQATTAHRNTSRPPCRGGAWTKTHLGVEADAIEAYASGTQAQHFCAVYGLNKQATFSIKKYTEKVASGLALYWCAQLETHLSTWCESRPSLKRSSLPSTLTQPKQRSLVTVTFPRSPKSALQTWS